MKIKNHIGLERLIGKIDNDFNISESDWIPRVAAWTIDALSQMKVLPMEKKVRTLAVSERVAKFPCALNSKELKVFYNHSEVPVYDRNKVYGCSKSQDLKGYYFVLDKNDNIILGFDADEIEVESYEVATYYDEYYQCDCPYIYEDGNLLEALAWYCMFKYLSRGSKHPVYSLASPNPILNPAIQWNNIKSKAATSVKNSIAKDNGGWNNFFYNTTFLPRN